jgi:hypothetical protein
MNFADRALENVEDIIAGLRGWSKQDHTQYFPIACPHNDNILALYNGSLMSVINIKGYMGQYFPDQFADLREQWIEFIRNSAASKSAAGFDLFWFYEFDPDGMVDDARAKRRVMVEAGKRRGLASEDILMEEADLYGSICAKENQLLLVVTHIDSLPKADQVKAIAERKRDIMNTAKGSDAMNLKAGVMALEALHEQHVNNVMMFMNDERRKYAINRLDSRNALRAMRMSLIPASTSSDWNPRIKVSDVKFRATDGVRQSVKDLQSAEGKPNDWTFKLPPKLSHQMLCDAVDLGQYAVLGERVYAPMYVSEIATSAVHLESFISMCYKRKLPVRLAYSLMSNSSQANYWNRLFASVFSFASKSNRQISKSDSALSMYEESGGAVLGYGLAATTWAKKKVTFDAQGNPLYDVSELQERARDVETLLQHWGGQQVDTMHGCSIEAAMSSTAGYAVPPICPKAPQTEFDCITQLPLMRPASLWDPTVSMWFRTGDGVLMPHQPMSKLQNAMLTIILGGQGYGKSNCISEHIFYFANHPLAREMPYIRGLDFGASSVGAVDMIADSLPADRKHEAIFKDFTNDGSMVKNVLDTRLCLRKPLADHMQFLMSWLGIMCESLFEDAGPVNVMNILKSTLEEAYIEKNPDERQSNPNVYEENSAEPIVVKALSDIGYIPKQGEYYYEIVDALALYGVRNKDDSKLFAAKVAQRYAVPKLADLVLVLDRIADRFKKALYKNGQLTSAISQCLASANSMFPCMAGITNVDISESRVCVFDMSSVFGRGNGAFDDWRRSIFFSVALRLQTEDLFVNLRDTGREIREGQKELCVPSEIVNYHMEYLEAQAQIDKLFWGDETHRVGPVKGALEIIDSIGLEGRKYQVGIMLGTQVPKHMPPGMLSLASTYLVFGASQSKEIANDIQEILSLTDDERDAILEITKPTPSKGAEVFAVFKTTEGVQRLKLHFQMGGIKRWAYATEADERSLRGILYLRGPSAAWARRTLSKYVPDVQVAIKAKMDGSVGISMSRQEAIEQIAAELLRRHQVAA